MKPVSMMGVLFSVLNAEFQADTTYRKQGDGAVSQSKIEKWMRHAASWTVQHCINGVGVQLLHKRERNARSPASFWLRILFIFIFIAVLRFYYANKYFIYNAFYSPITNHHHLALPLQWSSPPLVTTRAVHIPGRRRYLKPSPILYSLKEEGSVSYPLPIARVATHTQPLTKQSAEREIFQDRRGKSINPLESKKQKDFRQQSCLICPPKQKIMFRRQRVANAKRQRNRNGMEKGECGA